MKLVFTSAALADLGEIYSYISVNYPAAVPSFRRRLSAVLARIQQWPESAREVEQRPGTPSRSSGIRIGFSIVSSATGLRFCTSTMQRGMNRGTAGHDVAGSSSAISS
jgi:plasmid stabilization system protein ParE